MRSRELRREEMLRGVLKVCGAPAPSVWWPDLAEVALQVKGNLGELGFLFRKQEKLPETAHV